MIKRIKFFLNSLKPNKTFEYFKLPTVKAIFAKRQQVQNTPHTQRQKRNYLKFIPIWQNWSSSSTTSKTIWTCSWTATTEAASLGRRTVRTGFRGIILRKAMKYYLTWTCLRLNQFTRYTRRKNSRFCHKPNPSL